MNKVISILTGMLLLAAVTLPAAEDHAPKPNILLIVIDTCRSDHLGCYGYAENTSPFIDELASKGTVFLDAVSQSSWTKTSMASVFTSRYPSAHGALAREDTLGDSADVLSEQLRRSGYHCLGIQTNPWLTGAFGFSQGFDAYHYLDPAARQHRRDDGPNRAAARPPAPLKPNRGTAREKKAQQLRRQAGGGKTPAKPGKSRPYIPADEVVDDALDRLSGRLPRPFFLYIHFMDPHHPYHPPTTYIDGAAPTSGKTPAAGGGPEEKGLVNDIRRYDGEIRFVDTELRRLFAGLDRRQLLDGTLIVVISDHGEEFEEHGGTGHGRTLYNETLHVPLILVLEGTVPAGGKIPGLVRLVDVFPTILGIAGVVPPGGTLDGASLLPQIAGATRERRESFAQLGLNFDRLKLDEHLEIYSLTTDTEKVIRDVRQGKDEYFLTASDPGEQSNAFESHRKGAERLLERLEAYMASAAKKSRGPDRPEAAIDDETFTLLEALGYIETEESGEQNGSKGGDTDRNPDQADDGAQ